MSSLTAEPPPKLVVSLANTFVCYCLRGVILRSASTVGSEVLFNDTGLQIVARKFSINLLVCMLERTDVQLWATQRLAQAESQRDHAWWLKTRRRPERSYNATPTTTLDRDPYNGVRVGEASTPGPDAHPFDDPELGSCSEFSDDDFPLQPRQGDEHALEQQLTPQEIQVWEHAESQFHAIYSVILTSGAPK